MSEISLPDNSTTAHTPPAALARKTPPAIESQNEPHGHSRGRLRLVDATPLAVSQALDTRGIAQVWKERPRETDRLRNEMSM